MIVTNSAPAPTIAATYHITTVTKTAAHPQFGMGFPLGFAIDGKENPTIQLEVGKVYKFTSAAPCIHPFYFVDGKTGASIDTELSTGISSTDYTQVCNNLNDITFTVTQAVYDSTKTGGKQYYYNCRVHGNMGGPITFCPMGGCTGPAPGASICDKYSGTGSNAALLATVVDGVVGKLVATGAITKPYFDGTKPAGSTNFLDPNNSAKLAALKQSIVNFLYAPLGCSKDSPALVYSGAPLDSVHHPRGISQAEEDFFVQSVHDVLTGAGVTTADADAVSAVVHTLDSQIVSGPTTGVTTSGNPVGSGATVALSLAALVVAVFAAVF